MAVTSTKRTSQGGAADCDTKRRKLYSQADMDDALRLAYDEGMGLDYAAKTTCVPRTDGSHIVSCLHV